MEKEKGHRERGHEAPHGGVLPERPEAPEGLRARVALQGLAALAHLLGAEARSRRVGSAPCLGWWSPDSLHCPKAY